MCCSCSRTAISHGGECDRLGLVAFNFCEGGSTSTRSIHAGEIIAVETSENLADQQHIHPQKHGFVHTSPFPTRNKIHDLDDDFFVNSTDLFTLRNPREYPPIRQYAHSPRDIPFEQGGQE